MENNDNHKDNALKMEDILVETLNYIQNKINENNKKLNLYICKVYLTESSFSNGFLCNMPYPDEENSLPVLFICNYVLDENNIPTNIKISFDNDKIIKIIKNSNGRKYYSSKKYNTSIIEIFPQKDNLHNFLELSNYYTEPYIFIPYYSNKEKLSSLYATINNINEYDIEFNYIKENESNNNCINEKINLDGPIILLESFKVIGINKKNENNNMKLNYGILLKNLIIEFNEKFEIKNEITIKIKIEENDVNKDIYILNYPYYTNWDKKIREYNGLKELNSFNTFMYINNKQVEYQKYKKFTEKGEYIIRLKFNIYLTDAYCMFMGCKNIIEINLTSFITKNITNMCAMFRDCTNLKKIHFSYFDTSKVNNMNSMFFRCENLENIDLSSFNTSKVTNMASMFAKCKKLNNINLSSFDTSEVTNMNSMFYDCSNFSNIDLSSFDTKNVDNMACMFFGCNNLTFLDLKSFNTINVTDMNGIFYDCHSLIEVNISSFNTKNVTNMNSMFYNCYNLVHIIYSHLDTSEVINSYLMFGNCLNLEKNTIEEIYLFD